MSPVPSALAILGWGARYKAYAVKTNAYEAEQWLAAQVLPDHVRQQIRKSAIGGGTTTDSDLAFGINIGQWSDSVRTRSAFYRILADAAFTRVPAHQRVGVVTSTASGAVTGEGHAAPVSRVTINNVLLTPLKVTAFIVVTDTLLANVGPAGQSLLNRELAGVISDAADALKPWLG